MGKTTTQPLSLLPSLRLLFAQYIMSRLVAVALHHRDHLSQGNSRRIFGYDAYHWAIVLMPHQSKGGGCRSFEATDKSEFDPVTFRLNNPTMDWFFNVNEAVDLSRSLKLIGRLVIGQIPEDVSDDDILQIFQQVPLPVKNTHPQQSCVTWAANAIGLLQARGWVRSFQVDQFKDAALAYADERMKGELSNEPPVKVYETQA